MPDIFTRVSDRGITLTVSGKPIMIEKTNPNFDKIKQLIIDKKHEEIIALVGGDPMIDDPVLVQFGNVEVHRKRVYMDGVELAGVIVERMVETAQLGLPIDGLVNLLSNVKKNPSFRCVRDFFVWLDKNHLAYTPDGCFLAFKIVNEDFTDCRTGKMDNSPGKIVSMPRNEVDDNPNVTCSHGLHGCGAEYLPVYEAYKNGRRVVAIKVNPADLVAFPTDYNHSKFRCCAYVVVEEIPKDQADTYFKTNATPYSSTGIYHDEEEYPEVDDEDETVANEDDDDEEEEDQDEDEQWHDEEDDDEDDADAEAVDSEDTSSSTDEAPSAGAADHAEATSSAPEAQTPAVDAPPPVVEETPSVLSVANDITPTPAELLAAVAPTPDAPPEIAPEIAPEPAANEAAVEESSPEATTLEPEPAAAEAAPSIPDGPVPVNIPSVEIKTNDDIKELINTAVAMNAENQNPPPPTPPPAPPEPAPAPEPIVTAAAAPVEAPVAADDATQFPVLESSSGTAGTGSETDVAKSGELGSAGGQQLVTKPNDAV